MNMSTRRTGSGFGPNAISHSDVAAWAGLNGVRLAPFEVDALTGLESLYLAHHASTTKAEKT